MSFFGCRFEVFNSCCLKVVLNMDCKIGSLADEFVFICWLRSYWTFLHVGFAKVFWVVVLRFIFGNFPSDARQQGFSLSVFFQNASVG